MGLEAQRAAVAAHVLGRGEVVAEFVEVESGKRSDRPELARALAEAKRAGAVLLIAKLDRLARNMAFIANLLESGVEVTAADMPEANRFVLHIMAAVAEQEAAQSQNAPKRRWQRQRHAGSSWAGLSLRGFLNSIRQHARAQR